MGRTSGDTSCLPRDQTKRRLPRVIGDGHDLTLLPQTPSSSTPLRESPHPTNEPSVEESRREDGPDSPVVPPTSSLNPVKGSEAEGHTSSTETDHVGLMSLKRHRLLKGPSVTLDPSHSTSPRMRKWSTRDVLSSPRDRRGSRLHPPLPTWCRRFR